MFRFDELESIHLEITNRCQASCPMCARNINGGLENPNLILNEWSLEDFKKIINKDILDRKIYLSFCGCLGDPTNNHYLLEMCRYVKDNNPDLGIGIHTNGGARTLDWWRELAVTLPKMHVVTFGIDGLEDTHHLYRIGTTYNKVIANAKQFIDNGGTACWTFIKFKHNQHQVDEAYKRSKDLGFQYFELKETNRFVNEPKFPVLDRYGNFLYNLESPSDSKMNFLKYDAIKNYKDIINKTQINCVAKKIKTVYIDAFKKVFPCDHLASIPFHSHNKNDVFTEVSKEMNSQFKELLKDLKNNDAGLKSLKEIIESDEWQNIWEKYWFGENKMIKCVATCGKLNDVSSNIDQYLELRKSSK